jgi:hypothetical protein
LRSSRAADRAGGLADEHGVQVAEVESGAGVRGGVGQAIDGVCPALRVTAPVSDAVRKAFADRGIL